MHCAKGTLSIRASAQEQISHARSPHRPALRTHRTAHRYIPALAGGFRQRNGRPKLPSANRSRYASIWLRCCSRICLYQEEGGGRIACHPEQFGDVVLARKDAPASYHLCVTHDDALQGVTLVTRGEDLQPATSLHRLLQTLMGWEAPAYAHHHLLTDPAGRRLAKRDKAMTLRSLRAEGVSARAIIQRVDQL